MRMRRRWDVNRSVYYPDGHAYFGACFISFWVLFVSILNFIRYIPNAKELIFGGGVMFIFGMIRSVFPDGFHVVIGKRALFYYSLDAIFVVRIKSCQKLFDCVRICPLTGFTVDMFGYMEKGEENPHPTMIRIFLGMLIVSLCGLFIQYIIVVFCNIIENGYYPTSRKDILKCGIILAVDCFLLMLRIFKRDTYSRWTGIRKMIRVPDDEHERRQMFKKIRKCFGYSRYKNRITLPKIDRAK